MQHYEDVIKEFCKDNPGLDIYLAGEVSHPGISDLDFLVLDEKPKISERVKKYLKGGKLRFSPSKKGLVVVFDRDKKEYRMININTTQSLKVNGEEYNVT